MRLLLDSHAFVYIVREPEALPKVCRSAIEDAGNDVYLSIATPLELQIKINIGKLSFIRPLREAIQREIDRDIFRLLPITLDHIDSLSRLPNIHRDPFDRILIAQAICEDLTLVTADQNIRRYPVRWMWE